VNGVWLRSASGVPPRDKASAAPFMVPLMWRAWGGGVCEPVVSRRKASERVMRAIGPAFPRPRSMQATAAVLSQCSCKMASGARWWMDTMAMMAAISSSAVMWSAPLAMSAARSTK